MNGDPNGLIRRALKKGLSQEEQGQFAQRLRDDPEFRRQYEEERGLESLLARLPDAPVSTNFTSLVLQAVRAEQRKPASSGGRFHWLRFKFTRVAVGLATVAVAALVGLKQYQKSERQELARSVTAFTEVASVMGSRQTPTAEVFRDFEAIHRLSIPQEELDLELLVALQK